MNLLILSLFGLSLVGGICRANLWQVLRGQSRGVFEQRSFAWPELETGFGTVSILAGIARPEKLIHAAGPCGAGSKAAAKLVAVRVIKAEAEKPQKLAFLATCQRRLRSKSGSHILGLFPVRGKVERHN